MERRRGLKLLFVVGTALGVGCLAGQVNVGSPVVSHYKGKIVTDPEGMSGLWEASNGHGGVIGIHLVLGTTVAPDAKSDGKSLAGVEQLWEHLEVGVYEQRGASFQFGEEGYFTDASQEAPVLVEDGRLQLHFVSRVKGDPIVDLDLTKQSGDRWVGRFHRGDFDQQVTLERPGAGPITGIWASEEDTGRRIHVGKQVSGGYTAWSDWLQIPGRIRFGPRIQPSDCISVMGSGRRQNSEPMVKFRL